MKPNNMQAQLVRAAQEWSSLLTHFPWEKYWRAAPKAVEWLMVVLLAKAAADLTWLIFSPSTDATSTPVSASSAAKPAAQQARLMTVANLHLFGIPTQAMAPGGGPIDARETGLKLTLRGIFASTVPQHSMAIVADQQNQEKVYVRGDAVVPGVVLYEVYADRIILQRSGNFETLSMPREGKDKPPIFTPVNSTTAPAAATQAPSADAGDKLKALREDLLHRPQKFWDQVRIDPYMEGGQVKGFRFNHRDPQLLQSMGLQPSDVIVDVNGNAATDPSVLQNIMGTDGMTELNLGVLRNGQRIEVRISL